MPCKKGEGQKSTGRPGARMMITSQNWRVSWKQRNPRECVWKELYQELMKTILQEEEVILCNTTQFGTQTHFVLQAMKIPEAKAAVDKEWDNLWNNSAWNLAKVRNKSDVIDEARKKDVKVHFASLMDLCHLKNAELEKKHQKKKGRDVLRGDIVNDDSDWWRPQNVNHFEITWTRRASIRRGIGLHSSKNGRCSEIVENSQIGMSRHMDSSTTTPLALIMIQYGRPSRSSWAKYVRSSVGRIVMGKAFWESSIGARLGKNSVDEIKLAVKKQNINPTWKVLDKDVDLGESTSFLDRLYLGCTQRQCETSKILLTITEPCSNPEFPQEEQKKNPSLETPKISTWSYDMEGHAKKWMERCSELANKRTQQLYEVSTPCFGDHQCKEEEELKPVGELSDVCSQIVLICLSLARIGRPDILIQQACTCDHKVDQSLRRTSSTFDLIHSFHDEWIHLIPRGKYSSTVLSGTVSRLWLSGRSWRFKMDFWRNIVHIWKPYICSGKLGVQETDMCVTQFNGTTNCFSRCWSTHGRNSRTWSLGFGHWCVAFKSKSKAEIQEGTGRPVLL